MLPLLINKRRHKEKAQKKEKGTREGTGEPQRSVTADTKSVDMGGMPEHVSVSTELNWNLNSSIPGDRCSKTAISWGMTGKVSLT